MSQSKPYTIADLRRAERIQILHPQFNEVLTRLQRAHQLWLQGASARNLLLIGESGAGKTSALLTFAKQHPSRLTEEGHHRPVVYVRVPAGPTIRAFAEAILIALGAGSQMRGSAAEKTNQIVRLLCNCRTQFLLIDEFHHFCDSGRRTFEEVTEWLKILIDTIAIPTALAGLPECDAILRSNEQLRRRFAARIPLSPIGWQASVDQNLFRDVLHSLDTQINTERPLWGLADWDRVRRMHYATNGLLGYVSTIVLGVLEHLIEAQTTEADDELLQTIFTHYVWREGIKELNPFHPNFEFRRLTRPGEPFEPTRFTPKRGNH